MRQVFVTKYGGPGVLEVRSAADPVPGKGEVRIRVAAAGINFADLSARAGLYPDAPPAPMVVGYEVSGEIDEIGQGVEDFEAGDQVMALTRFGGYSDVVNVPAAQVARVPVGKDVVSAAGIPVAYMTSYFMLIHLGSLREGDSVLIHSAGGGVGLAALQLAKLKGAVTYGTASAKKHARLRELGLDHAIDYRTTDFEKEIKRLTNSRGVDIALDAIGGSSFRQSFRSLAPMGRLFCFGVANAQAESRKSAWKTLPKTLATMPVFHPLQLMNSNRGVFGVNMGHLWDETNLLRNTLNELAVMWERGEIEPIVDSTYSFGDAGEAHMQVEQARNFGKVLLTP